MQEAKENLPTLVALYATSMYAGITKLAEKWGAERTHKAFSMGGELKSKNQCAILAGHLVERYPDLFSGLSLDTICAQLLETVFPLRTELEMMSFEEPTEIANAIDVRHLEDFVAATTKIIHGRKSDLPIDILVEEYVHINRFERAQVALKQSDEIIAKVNETRRLIQTNCVATQLVYSESMEYVALANKIFPGQYRHLGYNLLYPQQPVGWLVDTSDLNAADRWYSGPHFAYFELMERQPGRALIRQINPNNPMIRHSPIWIDSLTESSK